MNSYKDYIAHAQKVADVEHTIAVLNWDQEVFMPKNGAERRAQQIATLSETHHQLATHKEFGALLHQLLKDKGLNDVQLRNVKESLKLFIRNTKFTSEFVSNLSKTISESFVAWNAARSKNDYGLFAPSLKKLVALKREECQLLGYAEHPYDAMLELYEPGATVKQLDVLFDDIKNQLVEFVSKIAAQPQNDDALMYQSFDTDKQLVFTENLLSQMGYDFDSGRQDISTHPFTTTFNAKDVRVTTRVNKNDLSEIIWSSIHEGGHALYEQGLLDENYGLPAGSYLSLGIHESQSRLYENNVGRSFGYWEYHYPRLQKMFPDALANYSVEAFYKAMNIVKPSLIRTNADELTYHFHVLIRYEIEKELIAGSIEVEDLPTIWNQKYKTYLNIDVPSDQKGVLQDIHWSHGSFGYFPTYSIGSFYAAQFYHQASKEIDQLEQKIAEGNLIPLLNWLRDKIHQHGRLFASEELCLEVTGEKLNFNYFMKYAKNKYSSLYQLN